MYQDGTQCVICDIIRVLPSVKEIILSLRHEFLISQSLHRCYISTYLPLYNQTNITLRVLSFNVSCGQYQLAGGIIFRLSIRYHLILMDKTVTSNICCNQSCKMNKIVCVCVCVCVCGVCVCVCMCVCVCVCVCV